MQNATRNAGGRAVEDDGREPGDLPRFLHRQNNQ
jgi:cell division protein FtsZ